MIEKKHGKLYTFLHPQENSAFDDRQSEHISTYLIIQQHRVTQNKRVDFNGLSNIFLYQRYKNRRNHKLFKKGWKNKAPGATNNTKQIIQKCTPSAITNLKEIFNSCLAIGYFPKQFKYATIKLLPTANKAPQNTQN